MIGPKYALEALHKDAYKGTAPAEYSLFLAYMLAYKVTNDLKSIIDKTRKYKEEELNGTAPSSSAMTGAAGKKGAKGKPALVRKMSLSINVMVPVKPMLARYRTD